MTPLRLPDTKDEQMEEGIRQTLLEKGKSFWMKVIARDGYINLWGFVDRPEDKREIEEIILAVPGIRVVTNHLRIKLWDEKRHEAHF